MGSSRVWFVLVIIIPCIGLSFALSDKEVGVFSTDGSFDFPNTDPQLTSSFTISLKTETSTSRGRNPVTTITKYHQFDVNGVPDYSGVAKADYVGWTTAGSDDKPIASKDTSKCIPKTGELNSAGGQFKDGLVGFAVSGAAIWYYEPVLADGTRQDALLFETFDFCGGHANSIGAYHLHGWNDWNEIGNGCFQDFNIATCPATIVGVAVDGFPIYSPEDCHCDPAKIQSDGSCSAWPTVPWDTFTSADTDSCNGRAVDASNPIQSSDVNAEHIYEYRLTIDAPYHVGCMMGLTAGNAKCSGSERRGSGRRRGKAKRDEDILEKALEEGAAEHLMELNEILEEAAREVEEEEAKREEEEKRMEEEARKMEEEMDEERRVEKLRSLLKELMNKQ